MNGIVGKFAEFIEFARQLVNRKNRFADAGRLSKQIVIVCLVAVFFAFGLYFSITKLSDGESVDQISKRQTRVAGKDGVLLSLVAQPQQGFRNIFQYGWENSKSEQPAPAVAPSGHNAVAAPAVRGADESGVPAHDAPVTYGGDVVLKGLAKSGVTRYALIMYGGKTQIYRVGDSFGVYSVTSISDGSVQLNTPNGHITVYQQQLQSSAREPGNAGNGGAVNAK